MKNPTILAVDDDPVVPRAITRDLRARYGRIIRATGIEEEVATSWLFAAGDVGLDSMNRVASAVGEGAMSVYVVHRYLATI